MKRYITCCAAGIIMLFAISVRGQSSQSTCFIGGRLVDSVTRKPLEYVTVSLKLHQAIIKSTASKPDGSFRLEVPQAATYVLLISAVGYQPVSRTVDLSDTKLKAFDLGLIALNPLIGKLKEVMIAGNRSLIRQKPDRLIYDLQADPDSKNNSVLGIMRKVPYLSFDGQQNLLFKGNSSFKVLIDGKPSGMLENNLKAILQSMPASTIQSIEVITNPPAKYDAEGLAGIINIITIKRTTDGSKGTLNGSESFPAGGPALGGSFALKQGKFSLNTYAGGNISKTPGIEFTNIRTGSAEDGQLLVQQGTQRSINRSAYLGAEFSYEVDSLHLVSGQFSANGNRSNSVIEQITSVNQTNAALQRYSLNTVNTNHGGGFDAGLNYQLGFKSSKSKLLTFSYHYYTYQTHPFSGVSPINLANSALLNYQQDNHTQSIEHTIQLDYAYRIGKITAESGVKAILRHNTSRYDYLNQDVVSGLFQVIPNFSDRLNYGQNVLSAYTSYQYSNKGWSYGAGLRAEETLIDADFLAGEQTVVQRRLDLIPNLSLNRNFKNGKSLSLGFNQRIKRPNIRRLNPFVDRSNPQIISSGNPQLKPVVNNNLQLNFNSSGKLSYVIAPSYSFIRNIDLHITTLDTATNVTYATYQNTGKADRVGADYNFNYALGNNWSLSLNGELAYLWLSGKVGDVLIRNNLFTYNMAFSSAYTVHPDWRIGFNLNAISRNPADLQSTTNGLLNTSFTINKTFIQNKLSFVVAVNNPITKYRYNLIKTIGPDFEQLSSTQEYFRSFNISLNYNFGALKSGVQKSKRTIRNDDSN